MNRFAALILLLLGVQLADACDCAPPSDVRSALERSDSVVDGTVVAIEDRYDGLRKLKVWFQWRFGSSPPSVTDDGFAVQFKIHEVWKGQVGSEVVMFTQRDEAACGYQFQPGKRYLVYARRIQNKESDEVSFCSRTVPRESANVDAEMLNALTRSKKF
jgi:hypothetical protein